MSPARRVNRLFPETTAREIVGKVCQEIAETSVDLIETTQSNVLKLFGTETENVKMVIAKSGHTYRQVVPSILKILRHFFFNMKEMDYSSEVGRKAHVMLSEAYIWASFCVVTYMLGSVLGVSQFAKMVISPIFDLVNAYVFASIVFPIYGYLYSRKILRPEYKHRSVVLRVCFVIGLLLGYSTGQMFSWSPPVFVVPLWIGLVTFYRASPLGWTLGWRVIYVFLATMTPLIVQIVISLIKYKSISLIRTWKWPLVSLVGLVDLQVKLGRLKLGWMAQNVEQYNTAIVFVFAQFIICHVIPFPFVVASWIFGSKIRENVI